MSELYFAFGSNLHRARMKERCKGFSDDSFVAVTRLNDHRLWFPRKSRKFPAVASVKSCQGEFVWGAVYRLMREDLLSLDEKEGYVEGRDPSLNSYNRVKIFVETQNGESLEVWTYIAKPEPGFTGKPNLEYFSLISNGARENGLPAEYFERLEDFLATLD